MKQKEAAVKKILAAFTGSNLKINAARDTFQFNIAGPKLDCIALAKRAISLCFSNLMEDHIKRSEKRRKK